MRSRPKVFYGWWVVIVAALALFIGPAPLTVYSFGIFLKSLSADFHAGRAAISFAFTLHNFTSAIFAIVAGRLIDRFGARRVILPATACFGLILLSGKMLGGSIWHFYLFYLAMGLIIPGAGVVPYGIVISHWFNRLRGLALGLMMFGIGFGAIIIPTVAQRLIATFGWRMTYAIFGLAVLLIPLPVVGIFLKEDPAQNGLLPDGDAQQEMRTGERHAHGLDWPEIWHSPTYWLLISAFFLMGACVHACVLHMPSLLTDRGVSEQVAAIVSSVIGVAVLIGRVATGYLLDRFFAPRVALTIFSGVVVGIALLLTGSVGAIALVAAFLVGLGLGAEADIIAFLISRYFGLRAFGSAYGSSWGSFVMAGAVGTLLMGACFDLTHSYTIALAGFLIIALIAAGLMTRLGPYRFGVEQSHESRPLSQARAGSHA